MAFREIFLRATAGSPEWARWLHLACSGSQSQRAIWFILSAHGARNKIDPISCNARMHHFLNLVYLAAYHETNVNKKGEVNGWMDLSKACQM